MGFGDFKVSRIHLPTYWVIKLILKIQMHAKIRFPTKNQKKHVSRVRDKSNWIYNLIFLCLCGVFSFSSFFHFESGVFRPDGVLPSSVVLPKIIRVAATCPSSSVGRAPAF